MALGKAGPGVAAVDLSHKCLGSGRPVGCASEEQLTFVQALHRVSADTVVSHLWIIFLPVIVSSLVWLAPVGSLDTAGMRGDGGTVFLRVSYSSVSPADSNQWFS